MLGLKVGVKMHLLQPQIVLAILACNDVFKEFGYDCIVTSLSDGVHRPDSLHYRGCAVDFRIKPVRLTHVDALVSRIRQSLGADFDVLLEVDHLHVEYDPKL